MNTKALYNRYIREDNVPGSNKASSYIRALDLLDDIIKQHSSFYNEDLWSIQSVDEIEKLYHRALLFQKKAGSEFLQPNLPSSYGRNGYYSAALKSYGQFLVIHQYDQKQWELFESPKISPEELAAKLAKTRLKSSALLVEQDGIDFTSKEGLDALRLVKTRIGQDFFRKMLIKHYRQTCCVSGLNIPEVLRASHIVAWKDDKKNRLNPTNGLCLSATYDAAFDKHLISFDEKFRMILSPLLKEYYSNEGFKKQFLTFEGKKLSIPKEHKPDQIFLAKHREKFSRKSDKAKSG